MTGSRDRGVSFPLSHVVTLAIAATLTTGLLVSAGGLLAEEREQVTRREAESIAREAAAGVAAVDGLGEPAALSSVSLHVALPDRTAGGAYFLVLEAPEDCPTESGSVACLRVRVPDVGVERTVTFRVAANVTPGAVSGGSVVVRYANGTLSVAGDP